MMRVVVLYKRPDDVDAFLQYYRDVHAPLARKIPGLATFEVMRFTGPDSGGEPPYFLMAVLSFPDRATFDAAMRSPESRAAVEDLDNFARGLTTVLIAEDAEGV
ncbi:MAG: EthD family reductase [Sphaerobacter sp.]|nr:EthD family reductase [Sphaerobacter sp.]